MSSLIGGSTSAAGSSSYIIAHLDGLPEFQRALQQLGARVSTRVLRATAAAGARVVRKAVREAAPVGNYTGKKRGKGRVTPPGVLKYAVVTKFAKERSNADQATYLVTVRQGKGRGKGARAGDAYYARWVEEGHRIVPRRGTQGAAWSRKVRRELATGTVRPHPFMRPATEASAGAATRAMQQRMAEELVKVLK